MRFTFKADGTIVKRCDKCGRVLCRLVPTGNPATPINEEEVLPYITKRIIHKGGTMEEMYYCNDCKQNCELR